MPFLSNSRSGVNAFVHPHRGQPILALLDSARIWSVQPANAPSETTGMSEQRKSLKPGSPTGEIAGGPGCLSWLLAINLAVAALVLVLSELLDS